MRVAIDLDGVLADFNTAFLAVCVCPHDGAWTRHPPSTRTAHRYIPTKWNWPAELKLDATRAWRQVAESRQFWLNLDPLPGAEAFLQKLWTWQQTGDDREVLFLTARADGLRVREQTERWLHGYGFPRAAVLRLEEKYLACDALNIDVCLDDNPGIIDDVRQTDTRGVLFRTPYNTSNYRHVDEVDGYDAFLQRYL